MKKISSHIVLFFLGLLSFLGATSKSLKALAIPSQTNIEQVGETWPLYLEHASVLMSADSTTNDLLSWHYSHGSHASHVSHASHASHASHYSHYSGY